MLYAAFVITAFIAYVAIVIRFVAAVRSHGRRIEWLRYEVNRLREDVDHQDDTLRQYFWTFAPDADATIGEVAR